MGARQKLNEIAIQGCVIVGGLIGLATSSWVVFILASGGLLSLSLFLGDIRPDRSTPGRNHSTKPAPPRHGRSTRRR